MTLWQYLTEKMKPYAERTAFAGSGITYAQLLAFGDGGTGAGNLRLCEGASKEETAISVLKALAEGDVAVPVTRSYGEQQYRMICDRIMGDPRKYADLAFVIFTSGSTGTSKGVMLTHRNLIANLEYISGYFRVETMKSICIARPLVHIAVLTGELLYALCNGLTIYFYEEAFLPGSLCAFLEKNMIDVFCATPTMFAAIARKKSEGDFFVKAAAVSGERLAPKTAYLLAERFPETQFYHVYGLTEHSPRVSALLPQDFTRRAGSIGKPIGKVRMRIRNGELLVRSPCVMKGYYGGGRGRRRFGWLCTGDAAHRDKDGYFYIDGRKDDMIIRAGVNIFPQEIEEVLRGCEGVENCVVWGEDSNLFGQKIVAAVQGTVSMKTIRQYASAHLPAHLIPNEYRLNVKLCYTQSGKLIRKRYESAE